MLLENKETYKAERRFLKAIEKDKKSVNAYIGLGLTKREQTKNYEAVKNFEKALEYDSKNPEALFQLARIQSLMGNKSEAYESLLKLAYTTSFSNYKYQISNNYDFSNLKHESKFERLLDGYRRTKLKILSAYSNDEWTGDDHFIVVAAQVPSGENQIILVTDELSDRDNAYWDNEYVIFDYKTGSRVNIKHFDADVTEYELLSSWQGELPFKYDTYTIQNNKGKFSFSLSDSEENTYSTIKSLPGTISVRDILYTIGAAGIIYYSSELSHKNY